MCIRFCLKPLSISGGKGFHSKCHFAPLTIFWGFSFALGHGVSFFGGIQHSAVGRAIDGAIVQQLVVILEFSLAGEDMSFYSAIL